MDSIATAVTPTASSQSASASRSLVTVPKVRICFAGAPRASVVITHAVSVRLPMSMPAQRGRTMSIATHLLTLPAVGKAPIVAATASRAHPSRGGNRR